MDWAPTEIQTAVKELSREILTDSSDPWSALAEAELLRLDGLLETCTLLIEVGRAGARIPVLESLVLGGPLDAASGVPVTAGLHEQSDRDPRHATTAHRNGKLYGEKVCVPAADRAVQMVIPAADGVYGVDSTDCQIAPQTGTNDDALGVVTLDGTPARRLGGRELFDSWLPRIHVGIAAQQLGLCQAALRLTAQYAGEREQFGKKIGTFQAFSQRAADAWIDTQAMELSLWQAAWRLEEGLPAQREVAIARYWASEGSHRVIAAAQHLHGGMGFDRDYPLHRYFLTAKSWEMVLGGASAQLESLGDLVAES